MTKRPEQNHHTVVARCRMAAGGKGLRLLAMLVYALALAGASPVAADQPRKIIIDTDFNVMSDDGQRGRGWDEGGGWQRRRAARPPGVLERGGPPRPPVGHTR